MIVLAGASTGVEAFATRLAASLDGTGPVFAQLAAFALIAISLGAGARATMLWLDVRRPQIPQIPQPIPQTMQKPSDAAALAAAAAFASAYAVAAQSAPAAPSAAAEPRHRSSAAGARSLLRAVTERVRRPALVRIRAGRGRRHTPQSVRQLAERGAARPEIARRTGLSQDAVGLALHLGARRS